MYAVHRVDYSHVFSTAYLTRMVLPSTSLPLSDFIAALASPGLGISTKAKPFETEDFLSITRLQDCTMPNSSNKARISGSVVVRARLRIRSFKLRLPLYGRFQFDNAVKQVSAIDTITGLITAKQVRTREKPNSATGFRPPPMSILLPACLQPPSLVSQITT